MHSVTLYDGLTMHPITFLSFFLSYKECIVNLRQVVCLDLDFNQVPKKLSLDAIPLYEILFLLRE
jgi:hypothetical protein